MDSTLYDQMFRVEQRHWWFTGRLVILAAMVERFAPRVGRRPLRIIEPGCGTGASLLYFRDRGYAVEGFDISETAVSYCTRRGLRVVQASFEYPPAFEQGGYDVVLLPDVIEHMADEAHCAAFAARLLCPGGTLIVTAPADPGLWSRHDEVHHHRRRYRKPDLMRVLEAAGLRLRFCSHFNTLLYPLAWIDRKVLARLRRRAGPATHADATLKIPPAPINALLHALFAAERWLLGRRELPFGLSLIAVAYKPDPEKESNRPPSK
ncbi:MAG: class I SAM-dependent methyltransferase [Gammaproteobacteria bacterium]